MSLEEVEQVDASNCSMNDEEFIEVKNLALMKQSNQMGNFPPPLRQFSPFRAQFNNSEGNGGVFSGKMGKFNRIGNRGCKHLTRTYLPRLTHLNLCNNLIGEGGLLHLSKRKWENMTDYNVGQLESKEMGLGWFRRTHFPKMRMLNISQDVFHMHEVRNLLLFSWKAIYIIEIAHRRGLASSRRAWTFQQESYEEKQLEKARELFQLKFPQVGVL